MLSAEKARAGFLGAVLLLIGCSREIPPAPQATAPAAVIGSPAVEGRAPVGSVITLEPTGAAAPLPPGPAVLDQISKSFVPEVLIVRVGQIVEFRNSEDIDHNVAVIRSPAGTRIFDTSTPAFQKYEHTFDRTGRYEVSCDVHPGMRATIFATAAPYSTIVDSSRQFKFADLPPGPYRLALVNGPTPVDRVIDVGATTVDVGTLAR
jgi:plastocyanin